eukprot:g3668.t1
MRRSRRSCMLAPMRSVGVVTDGLTPLSFQSLGTEQFATATTGDGGFQVFKVSDKLRLSLVSRITSDPRPIKHVVTHKECHVTARERCLDLTVWHRGQPAAVLTGKPSHGYITCLHLLGSSGVLLAGTQAGVLNVWQLHTDLVTKGTLTTTRTKGHATGATHLESLVLHSLRTGEYPTLLHHPPTYLNKIIIAGSQGSLLLVNFVDCSLIYSFDIQNVEGMVSPIVQKEQEDEVTNTDHDEQQPSNNNKSIKHSKLRRVCTCIAQSADIDIVAIGTSDGLILMKNLREDSTLMMLDQNEHGPLTSVSFRTYSPGPEDFESDSDDDQNGDTSSDEDEDDISHSRPQMLAAGTKTGVILIWNLNDASVLSILRPAGQIGSRMNDMASLTASGVIGGNAGGLISIISCDFLPEQPKLLVSTNANAISMYIFDEPTDLSIEQANLTPGAYRPRLLRQRIGHAKPITSAQFYLNANSPNAIAASLGGGDGLALQILSSSLDGSVRLQHAIRAELNHELSQGKGVRKDTKLATNVKSSNSSLAASNAGLKRLSAVIMMSMSDLRERDWDNLVTVHRDDPAAYTWSTVRRRLGSHTLLRPGGQDNYNPRRLTPENTATIGMYHRNKRQKHGNDNTNQNTNWRATACCLSVCSNFAVVGYSDGALAKFNLQSGMHRGMFYPNQDDADGETGGGSGGSVAGCCVDSLNRYLFACALNGALTVWNFRKCFVVAHYTYSFPLSLMRMHHGSGLIGVAADDNSLRLYDANVVAMHNDSSLNKKKPSLNSPNRVPRFFRAVRKFNGHQNRLTAIEFSPDSRWIVTSSMDHTLRVWDIPTARCVEWCSFSTPVSSLSFTRTGEFLVTSHLDKLGMRLWRNRQFLHGPSSGSEDVEPTEPYPLDHAPKSLALTNGKANKDSDEKEMTNDKDGNDMDDNQDYSPESIQSLLEAKRSTGASQQQTDTKETNSDTTTTQQGSSGASSGGSGDASSDGNGDARTEAPQKKVKSRLLQSFGNDKDVFRSPFYRLVIETANKLLTTNDTEATTNDTEATTSDTETSMMKSRVALLPLLKSMSALSPSAIDVEIRSMDAEVLYHFLVCLESCLTMGCPYELTQAYLQVVFKAHGEIFFPRNDTKNKESDFSTLTLETYGEKCRQIVMEMEEVQGEKWEKLEQLLDANTCLIKWFAGMQ